MSRFDFSKILGAAKSGLPLLGGVGVLGGGVWAASNAMYKVEAGFRSIHYSRLSGIGNETYAEGVHFIIPWLERVIIYDIRARSHTSTTLTGSRDLQMVNISLRALYKPDVNALPAIYRSIGSRGPDPQYDSLEKVILPSIVNEVLKSVVAQYNAMELIQDREKVSDMIRQRLVERARDFHILLDDVALTHINFSSQYEKAVESKQVAQQEAERAKFTVLKAQEEKKRTIINAEGEKVSAKMIGEAIKSNPGFVELRRINVAKEVATVLSKSSNRMVLSTESLLLNLMGSGNANSSANLARNNKSTSGANQNAKLK